MRTFAKVLEGMLEENLANMADRLLSHMHVNQLAGGRLFVIRPRKYRPMRESRVLDYRHDFSFLFYCDEVLGLKFMAILIQSSW